ncbi:O-antigen ligase family protein [Pedobacter heparinus]|uniref:O-antigen ligase-related domain-containing protein n=1 Tax=Pedobacter heparinus (strain ATCC 13125 / DSM 2366 / CIP 104194 / JCM 7457 / NBRC 12017 / NCIMB 9290 / NRRL B-14731 / HIM 762-3) TaxID=485917 RepID=C6XW88_PEDHD|nr:O-antigen ligase family protein [Pedobacter heparinus]ACU04167.1 hypothetical protein Phep_1959 [Pedobacter heparinus DSM 2366]
MMQFFNQLPFSLKRILFVIIGLILTTAISFFSFQLGIIVPLIAIGLSAAVIFLIISFNHPKITLWALISYCFSIALISREIGGDIPYGTFIEVLLFLTWLFAVLRVPVEEWKKVKNDLFYIIVIWFLLSVLEVANPAGASIMGWLQEIRSAALYPLLIIPVTYVLFNTKKDLDSFLVLVIVFSVFGAINGIKQLYIGLSPGEQRFIDDGGYVTHMLFGQLRVFSFYSEAAQFGASQAHIGLICLILAFGPYKWWKRALLFCISLLLLYGMLISGTRGALFVLVSGVFLAIILSKQIKVILIGGLIACSCLFILKFTYIGNGNYQIYRLRSALDPTDASFNVRLNTQKLLREYMSTRPFGGGLGVIGAWGAKYNQDKFLAHIPPDSYWVKVWAMYGIIGFIIWLCIMMYILGKCCGIVWNIRDPDLRIKGIAMTSGYAGILICSYGNEVINTMPSSIIVYVSWVFIFISPVLDKEISNKNNL